MNLEREREQIAQELFFIVGTGRCGTTLLQSMLLSHSRLYIPPETRFFGGVLDPMIILDDPLTDEQVEDYLSYCLNYWWWQELGLASEAFCQAVRGGIRSRREIFLWALQQLSAHSSKPRIGEKTPGHALVAHQLLEMFPNAKIIHLHRDPRDVVVSLRSQYWWAAKPVISCAMSCQRVLAHLKRVGEKVQDQQFLVVRYESLVKQPECELQRICAFLDEQFEPQMLKFYERQERGYLEFEEWKALTTQPLTGSRLGIYQENLSAKEIRLVEWTLLNLLENYGYSPDTEVASDPNWIPEFEAILRRWEEERAQMGPEQLVDEQLVMEKLSARKLGIEYSGSQQC